MPYCVVAHLFCPEKGNRHVRVRILLVNLLENYPEKADVYVGAKKLAMNMLRNYPRKVEV